MKNYTLGKEEVPLYYGEIVYLNPKAKKVETELIFTNQNFVFTTTTKRMFQKDSSEQEIFAYECVKHYKELPYIIRKDDVVEIYFEECEKFIQFSNKKEAKKFVDIAMREISKIPKFARVVKKAMKEVSATNDALGIDVEGTTKFIATVVETVSAQLPGTKAKVANALAKLVKNKNQEPRALPEIKEIEENK